MYGLAGVLGDGVHDDLLTVGALYHLAGLNHLHLIVGRGYRLNDGHVTGTAAAAVRADLLVHERSLTRKKRCDITQADGRTCRSHGDTTSVSTGEARPPADKADETVSPRSSGHGRRRLRGAATVGGRRPRENGRRSDDDDERPAAVVAIAAATTAAATRGQTPRDPYGAGARSSARRSGGKVVCEI